MDDDRPAVGDLKARLSSATDRSNSQAQCEDPKTSEVTESLATKLPHGDEESVRREPSRTSTTSAKNADSDYIRSCVGLYWSFFGWPYTEQTRKNHCSPKTAHLSSEHLWCCFTRPWTERRRSIGASGPKAASDGEQIPSCDEIGHGQRLTEDGTTSVSRGPVTIWLAERTPTAADRHRIKMLHMLGQEFRVAARRFAGRGDSSPPKVATTQLKESSLEVTKPFHLPASCRLGFKTTLPGLKRRYQVVVRLPRGGRPGTKALISGTPDNVMAAIKEAHETIQRLLRQQRPWMPL